MAGIALQFSTAAPSRLQCLIPARATHGVKAIKHVPGQAGTRVELSQHQGVARTRKRCRLICGALPEEHKSSPAFRLEDFLRLTFVPPPYGAMKIYDDSKRGNGLNVLNGVLIFKRDQDVLSADELNVLEVFVNGDTARNIYSLLTHHHTERPMVHELMWTLLEQAQGGDGARWSLLRVAITDLQDNVFIGRLFFGDALTGEVKWDCDCRPSDGCYLAIKAQCPFFVHRRVWEQACQPITASTAYRLVSGSSEVGSGYAQDPVTYSSASGSSISSMSSAAAYSREAAEQVYRSGSPGGLPPRVQEPAGRAFNPSANPDTLTVEDVTQLRPDDPPAIQLLKRELAVAVADENYAEAIRIRDHPWMHKYRQIHACRLQGRYDDAFQLELELKRDISDVVDL